MWQIKCIILGAAKQAVDLNVTDAGNGTFSFSNLEALKQLLEQAAESSETSTSFHSARRFQYKAWPWSSRVWIID